LFTLGFRALCQSIFFAQTLYLLLSKIILPYFVFEFISTACSFHFTVHVMSRHLLIIAHNRSSMSRHAYLWNTCETVGGNFPYCIVPHQCFCWFTYLNEIIVPLNSQKIGKYDGLNLMNSLTTLLAKKICSIPTPSYAAYQKGCTFFMG